MKLQYYQYNINLMMMCSLFVLCDVFVMLLLQVTASSYVVAADSDTPGTEIIKLLKCYKSSVFNTVS